MNISKEEAIKRLKEARFTVQPYLYMNEAFDVAIEALSQPERPKGRWEEYGYKWKCSECGEKINIDGTPQENGLHFCPNCGADCRESE